MTENNHTYNIIMRISIKALALAVMLALFCGSLEAKKKVTDSKTN